MSKDISDEAASGKGPAKPEGKSKLRGVPRAKKEGEMLLKGVRKFLRYNRDLIAPERMEKIDELKAGFRETLDSPEADEKDIDHQQRDLTRACEVSVPDYRPSILRENIEVVFVAFVIAMGIRAYFLQPFKIPTGSMQPTLNGITGHVENADGTSTHDDSNYEHPGLLKRVWAKIWNGRNYVDVVAEEGGRMVFDDRGQIKADEIKRFKFMVATVFYMKDGTRFVIPSPEKAARQLLNPEISQSGGLVNPGQVIARGYVETGDQVLVDKFSYHWMRPNRGQVFVFTTKDITGIEHSSSFDPQFGSQHYIKRLAGIPGDRLEVAQPRLLINGELAKEFGFRRVMSQQDGYRGYFEMGQYADGIALGPEQYFAMGDNSASSFDGRNWGPVPQKNIVGRALVVYWPFGQHFGRIR